jgi:hypothetical protein
MTRDVLLTGSVPLKPATKVLETVSQELGGLLSRISDGDQQGWIVAAFNAFAQNDALEMVRKEELTSGGAVVPVFRLKEGLSVADIGALGPYGYAEKAIESYAEFKRLRDEGVIPAGTRFQVTMPGPLTTVFVIELPPEQLIPLAVAALEREVERLVAEVPAADLAIQFDIAVEVEREEYRRTPAEFEIAMYGTLAWSEDQMVDAVASLASRVPAEAEVGFHLCSIWHHSKSGGQDNRVLVAVANQIRARMSRPISYVHIPSTPQHDEADFALLRDLKLDPDTKLYLGVIHLSDGLAGARKRIAAADAVLPDFGVAHFCGLGGPQDDTTLPAMFALHRDAAGLTTES